MDYLDPPGQPRLLGEHESLAGKGGMGLVKQFHGAVSFIFDAVLYPQRAGIDHEPALA